MATSVRDIFTELPQKFSSDAWGSGDAVLQFDITGDGGGQWAATIAGGTLTVSEGAAPSPSMTMTCSAPDMLAIMNGELSAVSAFMQGRVKIDGEMALAMKLQSLLGV